MVSPPPLAPARRAALLLAAATAAGGAVGPIVIGLGGIVGKGLLPAEQIGLATVPVSAFIAGSALAAIPAALSMQKLGRRRGFMLGAAIGAAGAALAAFAIVNGNFWLFALGTSFLGGAVAFGQQYRYAAADASPSDFIPTAIAWVMAGGVATGVVGPQVAIHARALTEAAPLAGPFVALIALFALTAIILSRLDLPPPPPRADNGGRPLAAILLHPSSLVALTVTVASFALMSLVMTATPLAMLEHHHSQSDAQLGIQWHVIAMFAPSFVTGGLIARFGRSMVAVAGLLLIALSAMTALTGTALWHFWTALVLLGVGWNFGFIAGTAMITALYRPEEAFRVQAASEFILFAIVAIASFSSGAILVAGGWTVVNLIVFPVVAVTVALVGWQARIERRAEIAAL